MKTTLTLLSILLLTACGQAPSPTPIVETPPLSPIIEAVLSAPMPRMAAQPIPEARKHASPGQTILLEGRIMGVLTPFVQGRAAFVLGDNATITPCSEMGDPDHCPTPWDACCDPGGDKTEGIASIQIVDETGAIIKQGLEGVGGLEHLSTVMVFGTVAPGSSPDSLLVNAQSIHVQTSASEVQPESSHAKGECDHDHSH